MVLGADLEQLLDFEEELPEHEDHGYPAINVHLFTQINSNDKLNDW